MLRFQLTTDRQPRTKNGQPPQSTTGVASSISSHCRLRAEIIPAMASGQNSAAVAPRKTGMARTVLTQKRRLMSSSSPVSSSVATVRGSSAMPHFGQFPGWSCTTSGCMGQTYSVLRTAAGARAGSRAMPHFGQAPGPDWRTSGCMGQV